MPQENVGPLDAAEMYKSFMELLKMIAGEFTKYKCAPDAFKALPGVRQYLHDGVGPFAAE